MKKCCSRGGLRHHLWRRHSSFPLPAITLSSAHSVSNLMCVKETWLKDYYETPRLPRYTTIRADKNLRTHKSISGELCLFEDNSWATQYSILEQVCTPDYEILTVSFRPFYLPQEFGQITVILVYVPRPNDGAAGQRIAESYNNTLTRSVERPVIILGDFNSCNLSEYLPNT